MGYMNPDDLWLLKVDDYQREQLPVRSVDEWKAAFYHGEVPALDLGSRNAYAHPSSEGITIGGDEIYIVDGLQRITTARIIHEAGGELLIPVVTYLGTTREWEIKRFSALNAKQRRVDPSVLLRNSKENNPAVAVMHEYSSPGSGTLLDGRVQWSQSPVKGNLFSGVALLRVTAALHSHFGRGLLDSGVPKLSWAMSDVVKEISRDTFAANLDTLFNVLARIHDFREDEKSSKVLYLRLGYMVSLARMFAEHRTFWDGDGRLDVTDAVVQAVEKLRFDDFQKEAVSTSGRSIEGLSDRMAQAANGARRGRLERW